MYNRIGIFNGHRRARIHTPICIIYYVVIKNIKDLIYKIKMVIFETK